MSQTNFKVLLEKYAEVCIRVAVNLQPEQRLWIVCPVELADFARFAVKQAYLAGAKNVFVDWIDALSDYYRLKYANNEVAFSEYPAWRIEARLAYFEEGAALLNIYAEDPNLMADIDPAHLQQARKTRLKHFAPLRDFMTTDQAPNAAIVSAAVPGWAQKVFPDVSEEQALTQLWDAIFDICRVRLDDPVAAWKKHTQSLIVRCDYLSHKQYHALHYRSAETQLQVGLPDNHVWLGGIQTKLGIECMPNLPTEEVFTTPHRERINGTVTNTKPLFISGMFIPKFTLIFENGRVVKAVAEEGQVHLDNLLNTDEGARFLGEVALVPHSSPISQSGLLFYNGLYDENAACHMALGRAYREGIEGGIGASKEDFLAMGGNVSAIHVDFMMGDNSLDVDGLTADGSSEALLRNGEWVFE
jgi:aminopeptidase